MDQPLKREVLKQLFWKLLLIRKNIIQMNYKYREFFAIFGRHAAQNIEMTGKSLICVWPDRELFRDTQQSRRKRNGTIIMGYLN